MSQLHVDLIKLILHPLAEGFSSLLLLSGTLLEAANVKHNGGPSWRDRQPSSDEVEGESEEVAWDCQMMRYEDRML